MNPNQQTQSAVKPSLQHVPVESADEMDLLKREIALVKVYQKLTGEDESRARSALMYILRDEREFKADLKT